MQHLASFPRHAAFHASGFSLLEMLVTLAIVAVTLIAAPSLARIVQQHRVSGEINGLLTHLQLARSETLKRGIDVVLCRSRDGIRCGAEARWHNGWIVFEDPNGNRQRDDGESVIRTQQALHPRLELRLGTTTDRVSLGYSPSGSASNVTFTLCDRSGHSPPRAIIILWTGRARVSDRDSQGHALICP